MGSERLAEGVDRGIVLSGSVAARHGVALHKQDSLQSDLDLDDEDVAALLAAGVS